MTATTENGSIAWKYATEGFGIENLPYASFAPAGQEARLGVRIGNSVLDVPAAVNADAAASSALRAAVAGPNLDALLAAGRPVWEELRARLTALIGSAAAAAALEENLHDVDAVRLQLPFTVADYVDFYASENHASNVGRIFRPDQAALTPNWKHLPIGYHGRAGTIVPSGTDIPRPKGLRPEPDGVPTFGPSRRLDIEAEVGFVIGAGVPEGEVKLADAGDHIFGLVLVNDWSARDIQAYEYVPLGPFLGKSFATSVSLWVVPVQALDAARVTPPARTKPLAGYLDDSNAEPWGFDIALEVVLDGQTVSRPPVAGMYWTAAQMLAHMTVNGAGLRSGDFFASGTVSGTEKNQRGSFLELSWSGKEPLKLDSGREMSFLEDGNTVGIRGTAPGPGGTRINFGEVAGRIRPAR
ncbi:fumarylacetoacetase [Arthrobacter sp. PAMC25564]|uniref:fumarylacetoacetase n=1 Tax=Arthrobacter sp. PAMC25564 TaxID=2565366 RepID=UPI0010A26E48|nr:fumarylacetoacetase [Arthrobacter sp. PAMC25564]QCB97837.1 fumarylacetoacetase [Arthrobacter sp. PAMC25564]